MYSLISKVFFKHFLKRIRLQCGRPGFDPWVGKIPWRRERLPTPVFWPGEFHGLYSPGGCQESDMTEWLSLSLFKFFGLLSYMYWLIFFFFFFMIWKALSWHVNYSLISTFTQEACQLCFVSGFSVTGYCGYLLLNGGMHLLQNVCKL